MFVDGDKLHALYIFDYHNLYYRSGNIYHICDVDRKSSLIIDVT